MALKLNNVTNSCTPKASMAMMKNLTHSLFVLPVDCLEKAKTFAGKKLKIVAII